jgi:hypothetical protein
MQNHQMLLIGYAQKWTKNTVCQNVSFACPAFFMHINLYYLCIHETKKSNAYYNGRLGARKSAKS